MVSRIGYCCTFVSPPGDETVAPASHLRGCDVEVEAKVKNLASRELADHVRAMGAG